MTWTYAGKIHSIPKCTGRIFKEKGQEEIALFHLSDGRVLAVSNRCPHRGGSLSEGIVSNQYVFCPLHDWKINLENGQVQKPDQGCVQTFPVKLEGESIWIKL